MPNYDQVKQLIALAIDLGEQELPTGDRLTEANANRVLGLMIGYKKRAKALIIQMETKGDMVRR